MNKTEKTYNCYSIYLNVTIYVNSKGPYFMLIFITYLRSLEESPSETTGGLSDVNARNTLSKTFYKHTLWALYWLFKVAN